MLRSDLISCHECGVLHRRVRVRPRQKARCVRCASVLYRGIASNPGQMAAIVLAALIAFLIAQACPIVELEVNGSSSSATLWGAAGVLWQEQMEVVAAIVVLFTMVCPALQLGALLYVTLALRAGQVPPGLHRVLRMVSQVRHWGMTEVLLIGILITIIKMTSMAAVLVQPGLFAFGALTMLLAVVASFDPKLLWRMADQLTQPPPPPLPPLSYRLLTTVPTLSCHACGLVNRCPPDHAAATGWRGSLRNALPGAGRRLCCARCGKTLHRRHPDSVGRTWALLLAAAILYIPANLLPVMYTHSLFGQQDDTIISGVLYFWDSGSPALAAIIFVASIMVPVLKLAALSLLALSAQRRARWLPLQRTVLYRMVEFVGRWSMLDIFVITLTVALVRFQSMAVITAGPGALAFCAVVVLTMLASLQFDPRLIWDPLPHHEKGLPHV